MLFSHLALRALDNPQIPDGPGYSPTPLTAALVFGTLVLAAPVLFFTAYSLKTVYPILAIVENPQPPAYEIVGGDDNVAPTPAYPGGEDDAAPADAASPDSDKPVTSSLRRTFRLLYQSSGIKGNCRGLFLFMVAGVLRFFVWVVLRTVPFLVPFIPLLSMLLLSPIEASWVHSVIRKGPANGRFWRNLPPFKKTLEATCMPIFLFWVGSLICLYVPELTMSALNMPFSLVNPTKSVPVINARVGWLLLLVYFIQMVLVLLFVTVPRVLLVRAQASLLEPDVDTVVPFDRSFNGTVDPAVVGGRGYVTMRDAFRTFSRSSWVRLVVLYVKVDLLSFIINGVFILAIFLEVFLTVKRDTGVDPMALKKRLLHDYLDYSA